MWTKNERRGRGLIFGIAAVILMAGCTSFSQVTEIPPTPTATPDPLALQCIHESGKHDFCYVGDLLAEDTALLQEATETFCLNNDDFFCYIYVWKDEESVANKYPLTDTEKSSMIAMFTSRAYSGQECFQAYGNGEVIYSSGDCD